jgi:acyl-CoA reductase-like NAD-dependent aldehyde dehydrogenase
MQSPKLNFSPRGLYIGGRWVASAEDKSFASINPSNMDKLADVPSAGAVDVDAAVRAAKGFHGLVASADQRAGALS